MRSKGTDKEFGHGIMTKRARTEVLSECEAF